MAEIALLCPTRGRPREYERMASSLRATAKSANLYAYFTFGDEPNYYPLETEEKKTLIGADGEPTVYRWNVLAKRALREPENKLFMLAADDIVFSTPCWDEALLNHYNSLENKIHVYALQDSRDPEGTPHPIVTREWIEAMGYAFPPIFLHWHLDTWTVAISKANNCFTHLKDYLLVHDKPSDRGQPDETHTRIRSLGWHERDKYVNETCQHFLECEKQRLGRIIAERYK